MESQPPPWAEAWSGVTAAERRQLDAEWDAVLEAGTEARDRALQTIEDAVDAAHERLQSVWTAAVEEGARAIEDQPWRALEVMRSAVGDFVQRASDVSRWNAALDTVWQGASDAWQASLTCAICDAHM